MHYKDLLLLHITKLQKEGSKYRMKENNNANDISYEKFYSHQSPEDTIGLHDDLIAIFAILMIQKIRTKLERNPYNMYP